jgi:putative membrane protein insertion efficiency factor
MADRTLPSGAAPRALGNPLRRFLALASRLLAGLLIYLVRFYQAAISPLLGKNCRYIPSCSEYFVQAVHKYGPLRGAAKGVFRICRCHPWHPGGYDPP